MDILDTYVLNEPSDQNILDIFSGEWSSKLPDGLGLTTTPGPVALFEDDRVKWAESVVGGFQGKDILELGPLEGAHSYMCHSGGANKIVAIEANTRAYLKCLCIKEIFKLNRLELKLGDCVSYLQHNKSKYDLVFASGVLYHMMAPIELLKLISEVSNQVFLWTHYYDQDILHSRGADMIRRFENPHSIEFDGVTYEGATQLYLESLEWTGFCGGSKPVSVWLTRDSIIGALQQFGFSNIQVDFEQPDHPHGPAFALCATKA